MSHLEVPVIPATSPTLAETMRLCQLRAGLSKTAGSTTFVLGNPKGWLGTAFHDVLEKIAVIDFQKESVDGAVERLWNQAVDAQYQRSVLHDLNRRFGTPVTWPGYYVAKASVFLRARELAAKTIGAESPAAASTPDAEATCIRERTFTAFDGKLAGRPDLIRGREIIDYKSGVIVEHDEATQADVVKAGYVRQLRIYGFLVKEALGWWPERGRLLPLGGAEVEVALEPETCAREAAEAVAMLDAYNAKLVADTKPEKLASPTPNNCKWCPFKLVCPPFWNAVTSAWSGQLEGAAVEGVIDEPPRAIHGGAAVALTLDLQAGSEAARRVQLAPLNPDTCHAIATLVAGDRVRIVGLRARPDGGLVPSERTVLTRVDELPVVALANGS